MPNCQQHFTCNSQVRFTTLWLRRHFFSHSWTDWLDQNFRVQYLILSNFSFEISLVTLIVILNDTEKCIRIWRETASTACLLACVTCITGEWGGLAKEKVMWTNCGENLMFSLLLLLLFYLPLSSSFWNFLFLWWQELNLGIN